MADQTRVVVFRHVEGKGLDISTSSAVPARLIDELYEYARPKGSGNCVLVIQREPGVEFYSVDTLTDERSRLVIDTLAVVRKD